jgi:hypothetical protein
MQSEIGREPLKSYLKKKFREFPNSPFIDGTGEDLVTIYETANDENFDSEIEKRTYTLDDLIQKVNPYTDDPNDVEAILTSPDGACFWHALQASSGGRLLRSQDQRYTTSAMELADKLRDLSRSAQEHFRVIREITSLTHHGEGELELKSFFTDMQFNGLGHQHMLDTAFNFRGLAGIGKKVLSDFWPQVEIALYVAYLTQRQIVVLCLDPPPRFRTNLSGNRVEGYNGCPRIWRFNATAPLGAILLKVKNHFDAVEVPPMLGFEESDDNLDVYGAPGVYSPNPEGQSYNNVIDTSEYNGTVAIPGARGGGFTDWARLLTNPRFTFMLGAAVASAAPLILNALAEATDDH